MVNPVHWISTINDKNLKYEIETTVNQPIDMCIFRPINDKNLKYEIETR